MINFSLNTCWRLIPTRKKQGGRVIGHLFFSISQQGWGVSVQVLPSLVP